MNIKTTIEVDKIKSRFNNSKQKNFKIISKLISGQRRLKDLIQNKI